PTGFASVDRLLGGGLRRRDLVVLGGDIGAGKSAFALGVALRVAQQGTGVAFLSGEMDEERLMERALAIEGRVAVDELRTAKLNDLTRAGIGAAAVRPRGLPLSLLPPAADRLAARAGRLRPPRRGEAARRRRARDLPGGDVQPRRRRRRGDRALGRQEPQRPNGVRGPLLLPALDADRRHARP